MNTYTAFCQQTNGRGTIWISSIQADNLDDAKKEAREACANDWDYDTEDVHVLGIAEGSCRIAYWDDIDD